MMRSAGLIVILSLGAMGCGDDREDTSCQPSAEATAKQASPMQCATPAPLSGLFNSCAPGYLVQFHDGVDAEAETQRLASFHGFEPYAVFTLAVLGFASQLSPALREAIRCEPSVKIVEYEAVVYGD
jgi:hypothetical protein